MVNFKQIIIILLLILLSVTVHSQNKVFTDIAVDSDNEGTNTYKYYLGYNRSVLDNLQLGVMTGNRHYIDPEINNSYNDLRLNANYSIFDNVSIIGNVSFLFSNEWNPIFYDGLISYTPNELFYFEAYIEHESVGTAETNNQKYISTYSGFSIDYKLFSDLTLVAGFSYNEISNNTNRLYQVYRLVYTLPTVEWIYLDFKTKLMTGGDYDPYYFSPNSLSEYNFGFGLRGELGSPNYYARFYSGGGVQRVESDMKALFMTNLRIGADFTPELSGELILGATNSQNDTYGSFWYEYLKLNISYSF